MQKSIEKGFSLAEVLVVMLVILIVISISAPLITKKRKNLNEKLSHGKWACKYIGDSLHSSMVKDYETALPPDDKWKEGCSFPNISKNVKYLWVELYGGGGGGSLAEALPWYDKLDLYSLFEQVPRDGEYELFFNVENASSEKEWDNIPFNDKSVYYTQNESIINVLGSNSYRYYKGFCELQNKVTEKSFAKCKTYTEKDFCKYSGDSHVVKVQNCIKSDKDLNQTFCSRNSSDYPPHAYISPDEMLAKCQINGKKCNLSNNTINELNESKSCKKHQLYNAEKGDSSPGLHGKMYMKQGEFFSLKKTKEGDVIPAGFLGGYKFKESKNGDDYELYYNKLNVSNNGKVFSEVSELVAVFKGGLVGNFYTDDPGMPRKYCEKCGGYDESEYPNSSSVERFYFKRGESGTTEVKTPYNSILNSSNSYSNKLTITNQYFSYSYGCNGTNGLYKASLYPVSQNKKYEMKIGKGGKGSYIDDSGVTIAPQNGESTNFGWIKAAGGNAANASCTSKTREEIESNIYNAGLAGLGGKISFMKSPQRDYSLTPEEDSQPKGRWKVDDAGDGASGMVIVSW